MARAPAAGSVHDQLVGYVCPRASFIRGMHEAGKPRAWDAGEQLAQEKKSAVVGPVAAQPPTSKEVAAAAFDADMRFMSAVCSALRTLRTTWAEAVAGPRPRGGRAASGSRGDPGCAAEGRQIGCAPNPFAAVAHLAWDVDAGMLLKDRQTAGLCCPEKRTRPRHLQALWCCGPCSCEPCLSVLQELQPTRPRGSPRQTHLPTSPTWRGRRLAQPLVNHVSIYGCQTGCMVEVKDADGACMHAHACARASGVSMRAGLSIKCGLGGGRPGGGGGT
jgi:hypothetical protein